MISKNSFRVGRDKTTSGNLISSLSDYLSYVEFLSKDADEVWFRGVSRVSYDLIPGNVVASSSTMLSTITPHQAIHTSC